MTNDSDVGAPIPAALQGQEEQFERQTDDWQRVARELRALADEHGEGFAMSDAALAALEELTTMDTVPAEFPPMARTARHTVRG